MIEVSDLAQEKLNEYMTQNNITSPLRVTLMSGGCAGVSLGLSLDEKKVDDESVDMGSLIFLIDKSLQQECGAISIDFKELGSSTGFTITSAKPLPGGGGCPSGSCGTGECG